LNRLFLILMILFSSCSYLKKTGERPVARVKGDYLYESDLKGIVPSGTSAKDSVTLIRNYIENWIRQKLIIRQAEANLTTDQMNFTKQLENYKNSLIIFEYENALIRQKLDTLVPEEEIESYYDLNQNNFLLKDNIVQIQYVKLSLKSGNIKPIRMLLISDKPEDRTRLAELCEKYAADYFLDDQNWLPFSEVLKQIPIRTYNQEEFLKNHRNLESQDSLFVYLVRVKDFKIKESISPLVLEKQKIRDIILNKRKIELIGRMQEDLYQMGLKNNEFEMY